MPGLLRGVARVAVVSGTATAVSNRVSRRQANRWSQDDQSQSAQQQQQYAEPQYAQPAPPPPVAPPCGARRHVRAASEAGPAQGPGHPHRRRVRGPKGEDPRELNARQADERRARRRSPSSSEVDAHHDPAGGRPADLSEPGGGEAAAAADVQLSPGDLLSGLGDHRVPLEGSGAASAGEVDGGARRAHG